MTNVNESVSATGGVNQKALRAPAIKAIGEHLQAHGAKNWGSLRKMFAQVPDRTWWNWVASAKKARRSHSPLSVASEASTPALSPREFEDTNQQDEFISKQIRRLNFTGIMVKQMREIDLLQSYALTEDGAIKNFAIFTQALNMRERAMVSFAKAIVPLTTELLREDFYNAVCDVIGAADEDTALKVGQALADSAGQVAYYAGGDNGC